MAVLFFWPETSPDRNAEVSSSEGSQLFYVTYLHHAAARPLSNVLNPLEDKGEEFGDLFSWLSALSFVNQSYRGTL